MVKFTETKTEDLIKRIENLKAERERTADCLERLEAEIERRKQEVPLGVPCKAGEDTYNCTITISPKEGRNIFALRYYFSSEESARKHAEMISDWSKDGLVANAKGEPIDIKALLPLLKKGWVAMDKDGRWFWYQYKPIKTTDKWGQSYFVLKELFPFNLKRTDNWEESLMECGL